MSFQGKDVVSKLNHEILREIAEQTGGAYVPVGQANVKLGDLYRNHLSRITARDLEESVQRRTVERYQWFLFPAALCFLAIAFFSRGQIAIGRRKTTEPGPTTPGSRLETRDLKLRPMNLAMLSLISGLWSMASSPSSAALTNAPTGREGARLAQRLYLQGKYDDAAAAYQSAARTAASANRDDYLFNAGCALLKAGKNGDAADIFRGLTGIEGTRGMESAFNLGCALYNDGSAPAPATATQPDPAAAERRVKSLRQAGSAFQKVLRQAPDHAHALRNLAVVAGVTAEAEEQEKIIRLMAEHGQSEPGALADLMLQQQRKLVREIPGAFTNTTPALIDTLEALALQQDQSADLMIPLKGKLLQAMSQAQSAGNNTNAQQQIAMVNAFAEAIRDQMSGTATSLRDLDRNAYSTATKAEGSIYTLWKGIAGYQQLLREDLERQTNAISLTEPNLKHPTAECRKSIESQQKEALSLTGLFKERFEQTVPAEGISRPVENTSTNQPAGTNTTEQILSPEDRAKIVTLAGQAATAQDGALQSVTSNLTTSLSYQRHAHDLLKEIEKLLPKEKQPQDNPKQQQDQQQQNPKQDQQKDQQQQQEKQKPRPQQEKQEPKKDEMSKEDLQKLLEKAKQREQEHEQEKRERDATIPMSPAERDW